MLPGVSLPFGWRVVLALINNHVDVLFTLPITEPEEI
jgi:hypothetical protein